MKKFLLLIPFIFLYGGSMAEEIPASNKWEYLIKDALAGGTKFYDEFKNNPAIMKAWIVMKSRRNLIRRGGNLKIISTVLQKYPNESDRLKSLMDNPKIHRQELINKLSEYDNIKDQVSLDKCLNELGRLKSHAKFDEDFKLSKGEKNGDMHLISDDHIPNGSIEESAQIRQAYREELQGISPKTPEYKAKIKEIIDLSENIAESRADDIIRKNYKIKDDITVDLKPINKDGVKYDGPNQFDKVYRTEDGGFVIIEAKGGASSLGSRKGHQQGSKKYLEDLMGFLKDNRKESPDSKKLLKNLENAIEKGKVDYLKVHQKFDKKGNLLPTEVQKFKI